MDSMLIATEDRVAETTEFGGIYDVPEAARYLRASMTGGSEIALPAGKLITWIRRGFASQALVDVPGRELLIDFQDLISMRVIAAMRAAGLSWSAIRRAERWLSTQTGASRPFATGALWTGQMSFDLMLDHPLPVHGLEFSSETGQAISWEPAANVLLVPEVQFGAPCIKGTRIPTRSVAGMVEAGDAPAFVARGYGVTPFDVEKACEWERRLRTA